MAKAKELGTSKKPRATTDSVKASVPRTKKPADPAAVYLDPATLVPWDRNPRRNEHAVAAVAKSIKEFGFAAPIVARASDRRVVAGHTRLAAALQLGLKSVPVRLLELTDEQATALTVADNRLGEIADWDQPGLAGILKDVDAATRSIMGYDDKSFSKMLAKLNPLPLPDDAPSGSKLRHTCPSCGHEW